MTMRINPQLETKIIAMLARGDKQSSIIKELSVGDTSVSPATVTNIKKRNSSAIAMIREKMMEVEVAKTVDILKTSRELIQKKLDKASDTSAPAYLDKLHEDGVLDDKQYADRLERIMDKRDLNIKDLTTVSKEMFNQSQIETGKPTSITSNPVQARENLERLLIAINSGKEEDIAKAIFLDA